MPNRYCTRRFLNRRGFYAGGYVLARVEDTSKSTKDRVWPSLDLTIADCGRMISLDFDADPGELGNSLHKIDVLVDTLTRFRAALVEEGRLAAERQARLRKEMAQKKVASPSVNPSVGPVS